MIFGDEIAKGLKGLDAMREKSVQTLCKYCRRVISHGPKVPGIVSEGVCEYCSKNILERTKKRCI